MLIDNLVLEPNRNPLVSIITPLYNAENYVSDCIESVVKQTHRNWELLIVDDCSSDRSVEIVEKYKENDGRIKLFKLEKNSGSGFARNKAIKESRGDFIAFLDSDDLWHPHKLSLHLEFMISRDIEFSHTSYGYLSEDGQVLDKYLRVSDAPVSYRDLLKRTEISCLTAMYDVRKIGKVYMPDMRRKQDYALWLKILSMGFKSYPLDETLSWYRQVSDSATSNKKKLVVLHYKFLRKNQRLGAIRSLYYTMHYVINGLKRYYL